MTPEQFEAHQARGIAGMVQKRAVATQCELEKPRKYRNKPTILDGIRFDSLHEADMWQRLVALERGGGISHLQRQVSFPLTVNGRKVQTFRADFVYWDRTNWAKPVWTVADAKSAKTASLNAWVRTKKLFESCYGITVVEL